MVLRGIQNQRRGPARCRLLTRRDLLHRTVRCLPPKAAFYSSRAKFASRLFHIPFTPFGQSPDQHGSGGLRCPTGKGGFYAISLQ
jgi:hypothetical protein